ncbi:MAG: hypothetical protein UY28_C0007G0036, partial [Candidatus Amesbacteria bacterium GW2011_GWB1_48_13]
FIPSGYLTVMKLLVFISVLGVIIALGLAAGKISFSYFSDSAVSDGNVFAASAEFPTQTPTFPGLVINEVASAAPGNDEWIEIFNPTGSSVNISGWKISDNTEEDIIPTTSPIPSGGYGVVMSDDGNSSLIPASAVSVILSDSTVGGNLANGGDKVVLKSPDGTTIDQMNYGSDTSIFNPAPDDPSATESLSRIPNGTDTDTAADWQIDSSPTIGTENSL